MNKTILADSKKVDMNPYVCYQLVKLLECLYGYICIFVFLQLSLYIHFFKLQLKMYNKEIPLTADVSQNNY